MKRFRKQMILSGVLTICLLTYALSGCGQSLADATESPQAAQTASLTSDHNTVAGTVLTATDSFQTEAQELLDTAAEGSSDWSEASDLTRIELNGNGASITGSGAAASGGTVTITKAGTYVLSGTLQDGQIRIQAGKDDTVRLVLNGVSLSSSASAPIYASQAGILVITMADGTENSATDASQYTFAAGEDEPDAAVFSICDLLLNGGGALTVTANYNNGICSKDHLVITDGSISVSAVNDALRGRDSTVISGGAFTLSAGGDGIQSNHDEDTEKGYVYLSGGSFEIQAGGDGIQAETALIINGGSYRLQTGSSEAADSYKGLKAGLALLVTGGDFTISSAEDALHSNGVLGISGGTFTISSGDDGMHADEALVIDDGAITVNESYEGLEGASITINGGALSITASDDGLNAAGGSDQATFGGPGQDQFSANSEYFIQITGGTLRVNAKGDGIDSNGVMLLEGGEIYVSGPTDSGNGALDANGSLTCTGGILVAAGSTGMAQAPDASSTQYSLAFYLTAAQQGGSEIQLLDSAGSVLVSFTPENEYQSVVISSPGLQEGEIYTLLIAGTENTTAAVTDITTTVGTAAGGRTGPGSGMWQGGGQMGGGMQQGGGQRGPGGGMQEGFQSETKQGTGEQEQSTAS